MTGTVLLIDDEQGLRKMLGRILSLEGFRVLEAEDLNGARKLLKQTDIDLVLCDVRLPDGDGVSFVREIKSLLPLTEVILLTAFGNISDGVQAIKNGAFDYLTKGNDNDRVLPLLHQAYSKVKAEKAAAVKVTSNNLQAPPLIGQSAAIKEALMLTEKIAVSDTIVLLSGETGTGKEVFAHIIHEKSKRRIHPFVAINCSAFPRDLLEGELFGHKAGAFTGATRDKKGLFEVADGGTLFLDEIGEFNIDLQAKLLRVLESGSFIKLGDIKSTAVDVRIIAATNRDLLAEVQEGRFRRDLFYRINVFPIVLPSLRDRGDDIPLLVQYFLKEFAPRAGKDDIETSRDAMKLLLDYSWPGNVRELKNVLQRATILMDDHTLLPAHLPFELQRTDKSAIYLSLASVEKEHIQKVLAYTKGNKTKAADLLGIGLTTLYRKIEEYRIATSR